MPSNNTSQSAAKRKRELRERLLAARRRLGPGEIAHRSQLVFTTFLTQIDRLLSPVARSAALYFPFQGEVSTLPFFRFFESRGLSCLFPRVEQNGIMFYAVRDWSSSRSRRHGLREPRKSDGQTPVRPDIVVVPGIAFSYDGFRIGFGAGHYDRAIAAWKADGSRARICVLGLAYDFQVVEAFPVEPHDQPLDGVVTESRAFDLTCKNESADRARTT